ncbi:GMC family oxidoreductase [Corallococcus exiguus]|uniref:GMC family oxidoreductase n=1 Tax=Corallococcus TaxID=83461 RepID=UPI000ED67EA1|nr:GMC family oxidoreductase [Corallococcus sp. AB038B]NNC20107.1 GMC family oxidoreductase [Corallococcus exiguus]NRD57518.1 GMC family oxidoreductase [Corallococcus exiguus]RKI04446.1 GMC family oxidoreductase [Corallococcus sp. AB038B]
MSLPSVDVCIVGSGAGGAPLALELGRAGFKVVVLEKGRHYQPKDFVHDEILNSRRNFFMPLPWEEPHLVRQGAKGRYERSNAAWTANCVGGGTVHMSGFFYRLKPVDFRLRSTLGAVPGTTVADWPISYEELAPFYDKAEAELGVSGQAIPHPFAEPRSGPYPLPPLDVHPVASEIDKVCAAMGWHALPTARGIISKAYKGRSPCAYCALCGSYGCETGAKSSTLASLIPNAIATGNVEVRPGSMARSIEVDKQGRAKSVVYLDKDGVAQEQPAKIIIASATAVESARLLLNSTSSRFPNGLANGSGLVGKNLLFSSFGGSRAHFRVSKQKTARPWLTDPAPFVNRSLQDFYVMPDARHGFRKGGTLGFMWAHPNPIYAAVGLAGSGKSGVFGKELKDRMRAYRDSRILEFEVYAEFLPTPGTSVTVEPEVKDKYGIPVAAITLDRHPADFAATRFLVERGEEVLMRLDPDSVERVGTQGETTILQHGTCRFGNDAAASVLDKHCRAHEVPNLYVVDGSFMPTGGSVPSTLTIAANSFRVADHLVRTLKG